MDNSVTRMLVIGKSNNIYNIFEDDEEEDEDELIEYKDEDDNNRKEETEKDGKFKVIFDLEDISLEHVKEIIYKLNELYLEDGLCRGLFKYAEEIRIKSEEKEKERYEMINNHNYIVLVNYVNINEIKAHKYENKKCKDEILHFQT